MNLGVVKCPNTCGVATSVIVRMTSSSASAASPASPAGPPTSLLIAANRPTTLVLPLANKVDSRGDAQRLQKFLCFLGVEAVEYYPPIWIRAAFGDATSFVGPVQCLPELKGNLSTLAGNQTLTPADRHAALALLTCTVPSDGMVHIPQFWSAQDLMAADWEALAELAGQSLDLLGFDRGQYYVLSAATAASNTILSGPTTTVPSTMMAFPLNAITVTRTYQVEPHPMVKKAVKVLGGTIVRVVGTTGIHKWVVLHDSITSAEMVATFAGIC